MEKWFESNRIDTKQENCCEKLSLESAEKILHEILWDWDSSQKLKRSQKNIPPQHANLQSMNIQNGDISR